MPNGSLISYYGFVDTLQPVHQERSQEFVWRGLHFFGGGLNQNEKHGYPLFI